MEVSFDTKYGLKWFRAEASALSYEKRRELYNKICQWERMALDGPQGFASAMTQANRERQQRPLKGHMRELLIEIKGIKWVEATDLNHLNTEQYKEMKRLEQLEATKAYNAKLDSALDALLKEKTEEE